MIVTALFVKRRAGEAMAPVDAVSGVSGLGLEDDCQANAVSPRQVLLFDRRVVTELGLAPEALRANVFLDGAIDELPSGALLRLGSGLALRVTIPCEPCRKLESHGEGLAQQLAGRRGMLARVVRAGTARIGDRVTVLPGVFRPLHESWRRRVADIVRSLPAERVLSYASLARLAGLETTYCRAFPRLLRELQEKERLTQADRVLAEKSVGAAIPWDGESYWSEEAEDRSR